MFRQHHKHKKYVIRKQASRITYSIFPYKKSTDKFRPVYQTHIPFFQEYLMHGQRS